MTSQQQFLKYKFLTEEAALKVLHSKQLKISRLTELNDIFDCSPIITAPADEKDYSDQAWTNHIIKQNSQNIGVLCFSKSCRSPILWGHYSDCATGLVLGFEDFPWGNPIDIQYEESRPAFSWALDSAVNKDFIDKMMRRSFGVKSLEWDYEEEVRYIISLETCTIANGLYLAGFPPTALKKVVIGSRSQVDPIYLRRLLSQEFHDAPIEIKVARPHPTRFEMELQDPPVV